MSKSLVNLFTVQDVISRGIEPLALRYLYLQTHYRKEMNFTWEALKAAEVALKKLWDKARVFGVYTQTSGDERNPSEGVSAAEKHFSKALANDVNTPEAVAALYDGLTKTGDDYDVIWLLSRVDRVLGLDLERHGKWLYAESEEGRAQLSSLLDTREELRENGDYQAADAVREEIERAGYMIRDRNGMPPELIRKT
jgi:cysteinyl-tRNA synthetase